MKYLLTLLSTTAVCLAMADNGLMNIQVGASNQDLNKSLQNTQTALQQKAIATQTIPSAAPMMNKSNQVMLIEPNIRATDFKQAFDFLKKEKAGSSIFFELTSGEKISNIMDISLMPGGSLLIFRLNTPNGISYKVVKIEDISSLVQS